MDAGSTDGTLDLLRNTPSITRWQSAPDKGQADAINRGFAQATGTIYGWLNCDDLYVPGALRLVADYFIRHPDILFLYGDALAIDMRGRSYGLRINVRAGDAKMLANDGDFVVQPAAFWRAILWDLVGPLDEELNYTLDYEWFLRVAQRVPLHYLPVCLAKERLYGFTKTGTGYHRRTKEITAVAIRHEGNGLPYRFRAEAAALHVADAFTAYRAGDTTQSHYHLGMAYRLGTQGRDDTDLQVQNKLEPENARHPYGLGFLKFLLYLIVVGVLGKPGIITLRLWANRLLSWRTPQYPTFPS